MMSTKTNQLVHFSTYHMLLFGNKENISEIQLSCTHFGLSIKI